MITIHKYVLDDDVITEVETHQYADWLDAQVQRESTSGRERMVVWAEVITEQPKRRQTLHVVGTGHSVPDDAREYIGTLQRGPFVFHIWAGAER